MEYFKFNGTSFALEDSWIKCLNNASGGFNIQRAWKLANIISQRSLEELKRLRLEECGDEKTGVRYGNAKCRRGRAEKIGQSAYKYQIWAVWS